MTKATIEVASQPWARRVLVRRQHQRQPPDQRQQKADERGGESAMGGAIGKPPAGFTFARLSDLERRAAADAATLPTLFR
jgi:hypothetical protein